MTIMIDPTLHSLVSKSFKKIEKESVVCRQTALFLITNFDGSLRSNSLRHTHTHTGKSKTREGERLLRKAAVKTTGVESLCSATPGIHRVPWIVVSLVNFKTEKETENMF